MHKLQPQNCHKDLSCQFVGSRLGCQALRCTIQDVDMGEPVSWTQLQFSGPTTSITSLVNSTQTFKKRLGLILANSQADWLTRLDLILVRNTPYRCIQLTSLEINFNSATRALAVFSMPRVIWTGLAPAATTCMDHCLLISDSIQTMLDFANK